MASGAARESNRNRYGTHTDERMRASESQQPQQPNMAHKRSASGNPRPANRSNATTKTSTTTNNNEERRHEERRVTERTFERLSERIVRRNPSPAKEKPHRRSEAPRPKSAELLAKDSVSEASQAPWNPEATLLPRTTAPLASRISRPPVSSTVPQAPQPRPLHELTLEVQEAAIVEDLLFVFMGYEGQYIRFAKGYDPAEERDRLTGPIFKISPGLDPSLADLTRSMLKMATYYSAVNAFVDVQSRAEFGGVNHALCASIRKFLHDYLILIAQLETQFLTSDTFTVHVLNIHTLSTSHMMHQLYLLAHELLRKNGLLDDETDDEDDDEEDEIENPDEIIERLREGGDLVPGSMASKKICKGGVVLGLVTRRLEKMSGDPAARALLTSLLRDASRPYMVMLNEWLHHGSIKDAHSEFVIKEQKSIRRERIEQDYTDEYWERRYTIRDSNVPPQLEGVKDKVLLAGKYLNVVRECGGVDVSKVVADMPTTFDDARFLENVNSAYAHANESLMQLLLTAHALPARLQSLKHYFFLDPSDYFSYFLELGSSELRKPVRSVNTGKLQSLLDLVLRQPGSIVALDPFKEDVKVEMNDVTLIESLQRVVNITGIEQGEALHPLSNQQQQPIETDKNTTGFTSLQLDYSVPFPVSLVISRKTVWRYQALFRYLLSLRHLESRLSATWQTQTRGISWAHKGRNRALEFWKRRAWTLRARMLVFVQQLLYFCTAEVIEPNWTRFLSRLSTNTGKDHHQDVPSERPRRTVDELMTDHINSKLMQTCTIFARYTNWLTGELEKSDPDLTGSNKPPTMTSDQWKRFQSTRVASTSSSASSSAAAAAAAAAAAGKGGSTQRGGASQHDTPSADAVDSRVSYLSETIEKWENNFSRHLQILLDALNHYAATETVVLLSLCARLSTANQGTEYAGRGGQDEDLA
ncbi:Spc97 / Spc98 family protein [Moelleriella libera RCEF 2490]|uniref:Spindle pole body component n=1 Tax=Moelleriella libera RCEF 2490 TaxID=1081109 RepID=A0A166UAP6_9HYPO|nr:Spc97 / Spc98 family protein [Moelleriella libera RCEF 2490]